jgi:hypothetical protein
MNLLGARALPLRIVMNAARKDMKWAWAITALSDTNFGISSC